YALAHFQTPLGLILQHKVWAAVVDKVELSFFHKVALLHQGQHEINDLFLYRLPSGSASSFLSYAEATTITSNLSLLLYERTSPPFASTAHTLWRYASSDPILMWHPIPDARHACR